VGREQSQRLVRGSQQDSPRDQREHHRSRSGTVFEKQAGNLRSNTLTRAAQQSEEAKQKALAAATEKTQEQYLDGPQDLLLDAEQVTEVVQEYEDEVKQDEGDDHDYAEQQGADCCKVAGLLTCLPLT